MTQASSSHLRCLLRHHGFAPVLLCSALSVGLLLFRMEVSGSPAYAWLFWNLFLAWLPYGAAVGASGLAARGWARAWNQGPLAVLWLLLFPNAPYLLTDFIHLKLRPGIPLWFDAAILAVFALAGWLLGLLSLEVWKRRVEERWGPGRAWAFVLGISLLTGYGIYLGRVERWNSWHVLTAPGAFFDAVLSHLREPGAYPQMAGLTVLFTLLVALSYAGFESLLGRPVCPRAP
ncbi:DUF1361 domain-containing protein [Myxococcaceae bacterium GXIMD 01537]